ncbi:hypothetical protein DYH55_10570 [Methylovirgula sp. 4M-Z18]|nr:hypothetical protein DYH55_10570 [Methylovirgula sp. 4M-Z18]
MSKSSMIRAYVIGLGVLVAAAGSAAAAPKVSCAGAAMMGGAQLLCSNTDPGQAVQTCTFSWSLVTVDGTNSVVQGSFRLPAGAANVTVYQAGGFNAALTEPVVLCQGRKVPAKVK